MIRRLSSLALVPLAAFVLLTAACASTRGGDSMASTGRLEPMAVASTGTLEPTLAPLLDPATPAPIRTALAP